MTQNEKPTEAQEQPLPLSKFLLVLLVGPVWFYAGVRDVLAGFNRSVIDVSGALLVVMGLCMTVFAVRHGFRHRSALWRPGTTVPHAGSSESAR